jgi:hypothetical protein
MASPIVTLTGVITDPRAKLITLMSWYFKSMDYNLGVGDDSQYSFTVDLTGDTPVESMTNSVKRVLENHFDEITVVITFDPDKTQYTFKVNVVEGGITYPFVETHDSIQSDFNDYKDIEL